MLDNDFIINHPTAYKSTALMPYIIISHRGYNLDTITRNQWEPAYGS